MSRENLLAAYQTSWKDFPTTIRYRDAYLSYFNRADLVRTYHQRSYTDAATLADFRDRKELSFTLRLSDINPRHREAKVETVYVALVGAKTDDSSVIECVVEHPGVASVRNLTDGAEQTLYLRPKATIVNAANVAYNASNLTSPLQDPLNATRTTAFWGRGAATTWRIYLDPQELAWHPVDLSGLTQIQVLIGYQAFLGNLA